MEIRNVQEDNFICPEMWTPAQYADKYGIEKVSWAEKVLGEPYFKPGCFIYCSATDSNKYTSLSLKL